MLSVRELVQKGYLSPDYCLVCGSKMRYVPKVDTDNCIHYKIECSNVECVLNKHYETVEEAKTAWRKANA